MNHVSDTKGVPIFTIDQLSFWTVWTNEIVAAVFVGFAGAYIIECFAYLPAFWSPAVLAFLGFPDTKSIPFILDLLGFDVRSAAFIPHWRLFAICAVLGFAIRLIDFRLRCIVPVSCSHEFLEKVRQASEIIPDPIQRLLGKHGYKIVAASAVIRANPALLQLSPKWSGYSSYEEIKAVFYGQSKLIVLGEFFKKDLSWVKSNSHIPYSLMHETGHAVDDHLKSASNSMEFKRAHLADLTGLCGADSAAFAYFVQGGSSSGRKEAFAEIFCCIFGQSICPGIQQKFPETTKVVQRILTENNLQ